MLRLKEGDHVRIVDRPTTSADAKSGLYYSHYRNATGTVFKLYGAGETAQAAIDMDLESLPEEVSRRHMDMQNQMRSSLTGEAKRQSAPGAEQEFRLRYISLVAVSDLQRSPAPLRARAHATNGNGKN